MQLEQRLMITRVSVHKTEGEASWAVYILVPRSLRDIAKMSCTVLLYGLTLFSPQVGNHDYNAVFRHMHSLCVCKVRRQRHSCKWGL